MFIVSFVVLGIVSMTRLGIDLFPERQLPVREHLDRLSRRRRPRKSRRSSPSPIEDAVAGINGVKRVDLDVDRRLLARRHRAAARSRSAGGHRGGAREGRGHSRRLPEQIKDPTIQRFDVAALPIATYAVGSTSLPSDVTRRQVEDELKPLLEQIDGVAAVEVNGGQVREMQVNLDPAPPRGAEPADQRGRRRSSRPTTSMCPAARCGATARTSSLRTKGEFTGDRRDRERHPALRPAARRCASRTSATVVDGYEDRTSTTRLNGVDAVSFSVRKQSGANTVEIAEREIDAVLAKVAPAFPDLQISPVHNDAGLHRRTSTTCASTSSSAASWPCWSSSCSCATGARR